MSKYTITIKEALDNHYDFGLQEYPIFDEEYRDTLNQKILNHYYEEEIGFETIALFKFYLNNRMAEIMPYYNTLYEKQTALLEDIEKDVNVKETLNRQTTGSSSDTKTDTSTTYTSSSTSGNNDNKNLFLDSPQGNTYKGTIEQTDYATNVTFDKGSNSSSTSGTTGKSDTSTSTGSDAGTEAYIKSIVGKRSGWYTVDILKNLRNNILNIDMMIINDLSDLFMGIF